MILILGQGWNAAIVIVQEKTMIVDLKSNMINHVEKYIGTISHGSKSDSGSQYKLNIAAIPSSPNSDLKTYITLGLSKHDLNYKSRFEILFVCSLKYDENQIFPFLRWLAETIIENKKILLRGQVIYLPRSIVDSTKMDALYVSAPFYFDDDFQVCYGEYYNIVFPLLVPLYKQEAELVEKRVGMLLSSSCWIMKLTTFRI